MSSGYYHDINVPSTVVDDKPSSFLSKRTIHKPQLKDHMEGFSLLSHEKSAIAITKRLTGAQFRLWHYLLIIDPFADRTNDGERIYHDIPSPVDIGIAIGVHRKTVEKDMRRLEQLGLYARQITGWQGFNLSAEQARLASEAMKKAKAERLSQVPSQKTNARTLAEQGRCYLTPERSYLTPERSYLTPDENAENDVQPGFEAFSEPDQTIHIHRVHSDLSPPTPSQEKEKEVKQKYLEEEEPGNIPHPLAAIEIEIGIADQPMDLKKDNPSDSSPKDDKAIKLEWEAAPGQPYPDFIKWRSQHYIDQGGHWAKAASANARSEIRNNSNRAADLWEQFLNYANRAADSALAHKDNGMTPILPPCFQESQESALVTKESVTAKLAAVVTPTALTAELTPVVPTAVITPTALTAELTPVVPAAALTPPNADNVGAYKLFSPPEETEVSPITDNFKVAFSQLIGKQSMPKPKKQRLRDTLPPPIFLKQPDLAAARETWAALPSLRDEIRAEIAAHPDWDLEVVDGVIQEVSF